MSLYNIPAFGIRGFRIIVIHPDIVCTERAVVIGICLAVWNVVKFIKQFSPATLKYPCKQLIVFRIITVRFWKSNAVIRIIGQAHPETISLKLFIALPLQSWRFGRYPGKQAAVPVSRNLVGVYRLFKMMSVLKYLRLHAVPFFSINSSRFPSNMIAYLSGSHKVTFVGGIDKDFPGKDFFT